MNHSRAPRRSSPYIVLRRTLASVIVLLGAYSCASKDATAPAFTIGQASGGGIVFYVDGTGNHGLIAPITDQSAGAEWGCRGTSLTGAAGTAVGTGTQNTADIVSGCSAAGIAARVADTFTLGGFSDWFLPSIDELNLLYAQRNVVGGFDVSGSHFYWSSTEVDATTALGQSGTYFKDQQTFGGTLLGRVRAIRKF